MRLWNEYEGTTIAGVFPIEKLIRPEGRSAFFSTSNGTGTPAVLRLIEAINDEAEILSRWKTVADLKQAHLIQLKKFGQTTYMDTPLIYVLMEATEADLAGILTERPLTADETREIAVSLVDAVEALHASDIIHEHIEPANVMATAGDVVKLRSDCVREAPEGDEGILLKKQDVHDLAVVLLQALTQQKSLDGITPGRLTAPFDQIIRKGMDGTWGLAQIANVLTPTVPAIAARQAVGTTPASQQATPAPYQSTTIQPPQKIPSWEQNTPAARQAEAPGPALPQAKAEPARQIPLDMPLAALASEAAARPAVAPNATPVATAAPHQDRITVPVEEDDQPGRRRLWLAIAPVVIVVAGALGWHALHRSAPTNEAAQPVTTLADAGQPTAGTAAAPVTPAPKAAPAPSLLAPAGDDAHRWHVVAYTYYRQDQAQHKVEQIVQRDPSLQPQVFSPTGRAPYLVALGGAMSRADALALKAKATGAGLPRDTYIQNYNRAR